MNMIMGNCSDVLEMKLQLDHAVEAARIVLVSYKLGMPSQLKKQYFCRLFWLTPMGS